MPVQRKVFRIEEMGVVATPAATVGGGAVPDGQQQEILAELKALRELIERRAVASISDADAAKTQGLRQLKDGTDAIHRAITRTKQEIANLHAGAFGGAGRSQVTRELDAVAEDAERATRQILDAAEDIEESTKTLSACLKQEQELALAQDIQDQVIRIFEACNFQDLSGQRITKVLATLKFIEDHVGRMLEIWGGIDAFKEFSFAASVQSLRDARMVHGPKIAGDPGHASQAEIDAILAKD